MQFQESEIRYARIYIQMLNAITAGGERVTAWYHQCHSIEKVVSNYDDFATDLIDELSVTPLYSSLRKLEIYDVGQQVYMNRYTTTERSQAAQDEIADQLQDIMDRLGEEKRYRAVRKASRSRWQGGEFGIKGAIVGAAKAGTLNAISRMGHDLVNAVGNTTSGISAKLSKDGLYHSPETELLLRQGVMQDISCNYYAFIKLRRKTPGFSHGDIRCN